MRCKNFITTWSIYYFNSWKYSLLFHQLISFSWFQEIKGKVTLWSILLHGSKAKVFNWSNRNTSTSVKGINSQSISTNIITLSGKLLNLNYWWLDVQNLGETHVNRVVRISIWASDLHNISREKHKLYQERKIAGYFLKLTFEKWQLAPLGTVITWNSLKLIFLSVAALLA